MLGFLKKKNKPKQKTQTNTSPPPNREFYHGENVLFHGLSSCQWENIATPPCSVFLWLLFLPFQNPPASLHCSLLLNFIIIIFLLGFSPSFQLIQWYTNILETLEGGGDLFKHTHVSSHCGQLVADWDLTSY